MSIRKCSLRNKKFRQIIKKKTKKNEVDVNSIIEGDCHIPELLFEFMCYLIQGPDARLKNSDEDLVKIKSPCSDIIFIISKGRIRPSKHLTSGIALK